MWAVSPSLHNIFLELAQMPKFGMPLYGKLEKKRPVNTVSSVIIKFNKKIDSVDSVGSAE